MPNARLSLGSKHEHNYLQLTDYAQNIVLVVKTKVRFDGKPVHYECVFVSCILRCISIRWIRPYPISIPFLPRKEEEMQK